MSEISLLDLNSESVPFEVNPLVHLTFGCCLQLVHTSRASHRECACVLLCQVSMTLDSPAGTELKLENIALTTRFEGSVLGDYASPNPSFTRLRSVQLAALLGCVDARMG